MSDIELRSDENEIKKETHEKLFFKFNLKVIKTNGYELISLTSLRGKQLRSIVIGNKAYNKEKQDKIRQNQKIQKVLRDNWLSAKKHKLFNKNN